MKKSYRILIVDDEENVRRMLTAAFTLDGHQPICAADGQQALEVFGQQKPDIVLMDIRMPRLGGMEALQVMRKTHQEIPVILMTAYAAVETAVEALRFGAFDYVIKPFDLDELKLLINRALQLRSMKQEINLLHRELSDSYQWDRILTNSTKMMELCRDTAKIAQSNASVLITGESGTGKELIAKAIHYNSARAKGPFIKINCGALPESLLESELFGHEKGAFTGAAKTTLGKIETAHGGTLMLDEIGDLPLSLQAKLLRFLQERVVERVGGRQEIAVNVRVVGATHQDLRKLIKEGRFREDLYYRLAEIVVEIPPLRQRVGDAALLAHSFMHRFGQEHGRGGLSLADDALRAIESHSWPGNIRELENCIKRATIMVDGNQITAADLGLAQTESDEGSLDIRALRDAAEHRAVIAALARANGNIAKASDLLGISRPTLYDLMHRLGLKA